MRQQLQKNLKGKTVLLFFILTNFVYAIMLIVTIPKVMSFSDGMKLMDMLPTGYDMGYVSTLLSTLGEEGRKTYLFHQIPMDMIYPLLFGISYSLLLAYFLNKLNRLNSSLFYLCLLPLAAGVFDYLENAGIIMMLTSYPNLSASSVTMTNFFTILKSGTTTIYFGVLLITLAVWGINMVKRKKQILPTSKTK